MKRLVLSENLAIGPAALLFPLSLGAITTMTSRLPEMLACRTPQPEQGETQATSFWEASGNLVQDLPEHQGAMSPHSFDPAGFSGDDNDQADHVAFSSELVAAEAIVAVVKNISQPTRVNYIWDRILERWVLRLTPV